MPTPLTSLKNTAMSSGSKTDKSRLSNKRARYASNANINASTSRSASLKSPSKQQQAPTPIKLGYLTVDGYVASIHYRMQDCIYEYSTLL